MARIAAATAHETELARERKRIEEGQDRIDEFLRRMRQAGNPGCARHDLTVAGRRNKIIRHCAEIGVLPHDDDPDRLIVQGWIIEDRSSRVSPRDSWRNKDIGKQDIPFLVWTALPMTCPTEDQAVTLAEHA